MIAKKFLNGLVILLIICIKTIFSYKYNIELKNEEIFTPCDIKDVHFMNEYLDLSQVTFKFLPSGSVYVHGYATLIKDIGPAICPVAGQIFRKNRDNWVNTIYNMNRDNMCTALFDPTEIWHDYIKQVPEDERLCPLEKGRVFPFNNTSDLKLPDLPDPRLENEYKLRITVTFPAINEVLCVEVLANVFRE